MGYSLRSDRSVVVQLLANTNYRAQIQADILPFKGILLGIFFMGAGSSFDIQLAQTYWPTVLTGALALLVLKAITLAAATRAPEWAERNRLPPKVRPRFILATHAARGTSLPVIATMRTAGIGDGAVIKLGNHFF